MVWHEGTCCICGQMKLVGIVACTGEEMCEQCFQEVQAMLPTAEQVIIENILPQIDDAIKISVRKLN